MCRMFGMVAATPVSASSLLCDAPRSLRTLSHEHADGWGIAIREQGRWSIDRSTARAADSAQFSELARREARLVVAHVRKRTVGCTTVANTHPFHRNDFVFAHNGTVADISAVVAHSSPSRLAEIEGETDSERLFAFVLTHVDATGDVERGVMTAVRALHAFGDIGTASFLLSCGTRLFAHRAGRTLFTLERDDAVMISSERLTDEPWREVPDRAVVILDPPRQTSIAA
jgi:predicted glutamine amidotransferase